MTLLLVLLLAAGTCPATAPAAGGLGLVAVAKLPAEAAMRENAEGKKLYREQRWADARAKYHAALTADPDFLDARLNLACAFSRQGLYDEAAEQASMLVRRAYVPWQREVREAADLGILQQQAEASAKLAGAIEAAAREWGGLIGSGVFFLARTKPPVNLSGEGVLLLSLHQEIFSWNPETARYFQVSAEDGHVLAFVRSADKRRVVYLVGGKLIRDRERAPALRGLSIRMLEIASMELGPAVSIPEEAASIELSFAASPEILVRGRDGNAASYRLEEGRLDRVPRFRRGPGLETVELTSAGVRPGKASGRRAGCIFELESKMNEAGLWQVEVRGGNRRFVLDARYGAGLGGLPFPQPRQTKRASR